MSSSEWRKIGKYPAWSGDESSEPVLYLRFVTNVVDGDSGFTQGVFKAAGSLLDRGLLDEHEAVWYAEVVGWFGKNLRVPETSNFLPAPQGNEGARVIFWMKGAAPEHISRLRKVAAMLIHHGVPTKVLKTTRPGRIVYEDEFQVGAIPLRDGIT